MILKLGDSSKNYLKQRLKEYGILEQDPVSSYHLWSLCHNLFVKTTFSTEGSALQYRHLLKCQELIYHLPPPNPDMSILSCGGLELQQSQMNSWLTVSCQWGTASTQRQSPCTKWSVETLKPQALLLIMHFNINQNFSHFLCLSLYLYLCDHYSHWFLSGNVPSGEEYSMISWLSGTLLFYSCLTFLPVLVQPVVFNRWWTKENWF